MTELIINPGSGAVQASGEGWTNSYAGARAEAGKWLEGMHAEGMTDVTLLDGASAGEGVNAGRWRFRFRHEVTGAVVTLETPGIDDWDAYGREFIFLPRIYWNGSSSGDPKLEDFAAPGFRAVRTFVAEPGTAPPSAGGGE